MPEPSVQEHPSGALSVLGTEATVVSSAQGGPQGSRAVGAERIMNRKHDSLNLEGSPGMGGSIGNVVQQLHPLECAFSGQRYSPSASWTLSSGREPV